MQIPNHFTFPQVRWFVATFSWLFGKSGGLWPIFLATFFTFPQLWVSALNLLQVVSVEAQLGPTGRFAFKLGIIHGTNPKKWANSHGTKGQEKDRKVFGSGLFGVKVCTYHFHRRWHFSRSVWGIRKKNLSMTRTFRRVYSTARTSFFNHQICQGFLQPVGVAQKSQQMKFKTIIHHEIWGCPILKQSRVLGNDMQLHWIYLSI